MSRATECDGPGCVARESAPAQFDVDDVGWIHVEASEDADHADFCSWTCLAAWAVRHALEREGAVTDVEDET